MNKQLVTCIKIVYAHEVSVAAARNFPAHPHHHPPWIDQASQLIPGYFSGIK